MTSSSQALVGAKLPDRVRERFGVLPNFFRLAPETPEITEALWGFAGFAYLDNPLPSVFKERLFVQLSRFCSVRYCIARHVGFLIGLGRPAGDPKATAQRPEDVVRLLQRPLPRETELASFISICGDCAAPLTDLPAADSQMEQAIFALSSHVFLQTENARPCLQALKRLLAPVRFQYLIVFLTFVRAAHYWTKVHPELQFEADLDELLKVEEELAKCILDDPEARADSVCASILDELPDLRQQADKATNLLVAIVDSSEDAIISIDLQGRITTWNKGAERLFGYSAPEANGQRILLIVPSERRDEEAAILERIGRGDGLSHFDTVRVRKGGASVHVALTVSPIKNAAGKIIGASVIARDVTQRKRDEGALRESEERLRTLADALDTQVQFRTQELQRRNVAMVKQSRQLQDLSQRLLRMQDEERQHIARELHDSAGQTLAALGMTLSRIKEESSTNAQFGSHVKDAEEMVAQLTQEIRTTSYLLHPPMLDESGLQAALHWYVEGLAKRSDLQIDLKIADNFERFSREVELTIFRLVQESLTNIHRHSGSATAGIHLTCEGDRICIEIQDRGRGISPERLVEVQSQGGGVGIRGMRERLRPFKGELTIDSNELGTKIRATLSAEPLAAI